MVLVIGGLLAGATVSGVETNALGAGQLADRQLLTEVLGILGDLAHVTLLTLPLALAVLLLIRRGLGAVEAAASAGLTAAHMPGEGHRRGSAVSPGDFWLPVPIGLDGHELPTAPQHAMTKNQGTRYDQEPRHSRRNRLGGQVVVVTAISSSTASACAGNRG